MFDADEHINIATQELQQLEERIQAGEVPSEYSLSDDIAVASYKNRRAVEGYHEIEMTESRQVMSNIFTELFPRGLRNHSGGDGQFTSAVGCIAPTELYQWRVGVRYS